MKKLSKILVVALTLAMLLGVVVISASADSEPITYTVDGAAGVGCDSLEEAIAAANADTSGKGITITLNSDVTLSQAITLTRADGKVTIDLNGKKLTVSVTNQTYFYGTHIGSGTYAVKANTVFVKASAEAEAEEYFINSLAVTSAEGDPITSFTAGETYVGTVTAGAKVTAAKDLVSKGAITVGAGADLSLIGNGGNIESGVKSVLFFIEDDGVGANLHVDDVTIKKTIDRHTPVLYAREGKVTFNNVYANI